VTVRRVIPTDRLLEEALGHPAELLDLEPLVGIVRHPANADALAPIRLIVKLELEDRQSDEPGITVGSKQLGAQSGCQELGMGRDDEGLYDPA